MDLFHGLQVDLRSTVDLCGLQGHCCFTMICTMCCRGTSAPGSEAPPSPPFPLPLVSVESLLSCRLAPVFSGHSYICSNTIFSFLNMLSQRPYDHLQLAQPWPAVDLSQTWLALAQLDMGEASGSFSQTTLL